MPRKIAYLKTAPSQRSPRDPDESFYKQKRWRLVRHRKLLLNPLCELCEAKGLTVPAEQVHHVKERREHPELSYDMANLQSLCAPCHGAQRRGKSLYHD